MATNSLDWTLSVSNIGSSWGTVNLILVDDPIEAMITDRYAAGDGQPMEGVGNWLDTYGDKLVLYMASDDAAGAGEHGVTAGYYIANPTTPAHDPYLEDAGYNTTIPSSTLAAPAVIWSASNGSGSYPYVIVVFDGVGTVIGIIRDDLNTVSSVVGGDTILSDGWHVVGVGYDGTNIFITTDAVVEATEIAVASGVMTGLDTTTLGAVQLQGQYSNVYGANVSLPIGRTLIYDTATLPLGRLSAADRLEIYNTLKRTYTLLP